MEEKVINAQTIDDFKGLIHSTLSEMNECINKRVENLDLSKSDTVELKVMIDLSYISTTLNFMKELIPDFKVKMWKDIKAIVEED